MKQDNVLFWDLIIFLITFELYCHVLCLCKFQNIVFNQPINQSIPDLSILVDKSGLNFVGPSSTYSRPGQLAERAAMEDTYDLRMQDEALIFCVSNYPVLFDKSHPFYHQTTHRQRAFRAVSHDTGIDGKYK